jgi:hypothetical protein
MAEFVDYKEAPIGDKIGWNIEYKPVWDVEGKIAGWRPKAAVYARGGRAEVVYSDVNANYIVKVDKESAEPVEKRGLYDLYIDNHIDIPESISKESPCYKQFMKEMEGK